MQIVTTPSKTSQVTKILRKEIKEGELDVGTRLPGVREMAARFGVSSRIISLAVEQLSHENLLARKYGKGIYVKDWRYSSAIEVYFLHWTRFNSISEHSRVLVEMTYPPYLKEGFHFTTRSLFNNQLDQNYLSREIMDIATKFEMNCLLMNGTGVMPEIVESLKKVPFPVIFLGDFHLEEMEKFGFNQISGDVFMDGYRSVETISKLGYKEMLLIQPMKNFYNHLHHQGALQAGMDLSVKITTIPFHYCGNDKNPEITEKRSLDSIKKLDPEMVRSMPAVCFGINSEMLKEELEKYWNTDSPPWLVRTLRSCYWTDFYDCIFTSIKKIVFDREEIGHIKLDLPLLLTDLVSDKQWLHKGTIEPKNLKKEELIVF